MNIGVMLKDVRWNPGIFDPENAYYMKKSYGLFSEVGKKLGHNVFIGKYTWFEKDGMKKAWTFDRKWKRLRNVKIDIVLDRFVDRTERQKDVLRKITRRISVRVVNDPSFSDSFHDKFLLYKKFRTYMPKTFLIKDRKSFDRGIGRISSGKVVLKPRRGAMGKQVYVLDKSSAKYKPYFKDFILQEFVETRVRGDGAQDVRFVVLDGKIIDMYIRSTNRGFLTNISHGASMKRPRHIQRNVSRILQDIKKEADKNGGVFYTIDFMIDTKRKPWFIELNSHPGITGLYRSSKDKDISKKLPAKIRNFEKIIDALERIFHSASISEST